MERPHFSIFSRDTFIIEDGMHQYHTFLIVLEGRFEVTVNDRHFVVGEGEVFFFEGGARFLRKVIDPLKLVYIETENALPFESGPLRFRDTQRLRGTIDLMQVCWENGLAEQFSALLEDLLLQYKLETMIATEQKRSEEVAAFVRAADARFSEKISVKEFCRDVYMSENGFILKFKREMGITPLAYLNRIRIRKSKEYLLNTDKPLAEIAELCGFENAYYFSNAFKRQAGVSPRTFRKAGYRL